MELAANGVPVRGPFLQKIYRWTPVIFFLAVMILYLTMLIDFVFVDEVDVFYGGYNVVHSGDIYKVYPTQHMPFSYYMSALIALFGANSAYWYRIGFYLMMSGLWTAVYVHHRDHLNNWALLGLPFFYVFQLKQHSLATSMISDHWQGIGLILLILEVLRYRRTWRIPLSSAIFVSLGIVLSLGTAFVSAYSVFIVFVGVALMQALRLRKHPEERKTAFREDIRLVLVAMAPFAVLGLWYILSGNLQNFFGGAYELNVSIYSRYIGGFGADAGGTFLGVLPRWIAYIRYGAETIASDPITGITATVRNIGLIVFCVMIMKDHPIAGLTMLGASIFAGVRAFDGFHGAPYMAVCSIPMAFWLGEGILWFYRRKTWPRGISLAAALGLVAVLVVPAARDVYNLRYIPQYLAPTVTSATNRTTLEVLTDPEERIITGDLSVSSGTVMRNRLKLSECSTATGNPWFYEYYGARELANLKEEKTRVLRFCPDDELWGYYIRDYAADFVQYVEDNYHLMDEAVYVRNDALPDAIDRLHSAGYGMIDLSVPPRDYWVLGDQLRSGETVEEHFAPLGSEICAVRVKTATYFGGNRIGLHCVLKEEETGKILAETTCAKDQMKDNDYVRFPLHAEVTPGGRYVICLTAEELEDPEEETKLHIYRSEEGAADGENWAVTGGEKQDCILGIRVEYGIDEQCMILGAR